MRLYYKEIRPMFPMAEINRRKEKNIKRLRFICAILLSAFLIWWLISYYSKSTFDPNCWTVAATVGWAGLACLCVTFAMSPSALRDRVATKTWLIIIMLALSAIVIAFCMQPIKNIYLVYDTGNLVHKCGLGYTEVDGIKMPHGFRQDIIVNGNYNENICLRKRSYAETGYNRSGTLGLAKNSTEMLIGSVNTDPLIEIIKPRTYLVLGKDYEIYPCFGRVPNEYYIQKTNVREFDVYYVDSYSPEHLQTEEDKTKEDLSQKDEIRINRLY